MLTTLIDRWLAARRASGLTLKYYELHLRRFAEFAAARGEDYIRADTAVEWASQAATPGQRYRRFHPLVALARYLHAEDPRHEILPAGWFPAKSHRPVPYIYSTDEARRLLEAAAQLGPPGSLRPHTVSTVLALLFATGLRISEALALRVADMLPDGLMVRETKFRKTRLVPLHPTARIGLERYLHRRSAAKWGRDYLFVALNGSHLSYAAIRGAWLDVLSRSGLSPRRPEVRKPRLHDIRHTFAVRALESAPARRDQIARHMLAVSTYLGHSCVADTYWYFQSTPTLMSQVADACQAQFEGGRP
jgi:integrase/recombinase XerD